MKTTDQNRKEVINYLTKTSKHVFIKPKATFKWGDANKPGYYEYDYENSTYFKVFSEDEKWFYIEDGKVKDLDIEHYIKYYDSNAMCVISHKLFLDKKMKSIRNTKFVKSQIDQILNPVK